MNYFDIFRIQYDDLKIIAQNPEAIVTSAKKTETGFIGEIILLGDHPERNSNTLFFHENTFSTAEETYSDLEQIIDTITIAFQNTKRSEGIRRDNFIE